MQQVSENHATTSNTLIKAFMQTIQEAVVIEDHKLELILATMLARGHVLLEDIPGIGKTMVAKAIAKSMRASFKRVQCTPDLLPSDITGSAIFNQREQTFDFVAGPLFANLVLVDEINRASPRTQSSLLEAMAEGQVTTDGTTRNLPNPFFIIATQNPIEMAGTFPLPEAQLDRFLVMLDLGYPEYMDEVTILEREERDNPLENVEAVLDMQDIINLQNQTRDVAVVRPLKEYIVNINTATRTHADVVLGISPRGGVALQRCAQALALIRGRSFVTPDDIKSAVYAVGTHRILTRDRKPDTAKQVISDVLSNIRVPVE
ncbi:MAG: MoxR family ATPase [Anaerolineae bacterium]|nr:MoxR family ATPase [Anaerolineae bacterium]